MKKLVLSISAVAMLGITTRAQVPAGFNYQGIARSSTGAPLASRSLGIRITIHDGTPAGSSVYQETHSVTTNPYGLYNLTIGSGTPVTGTLGGVNWSAGAKYIQVELDAAGGGAYTDLGTSQLQSVPYAMAAGSAPAPNLTLTGGTLSAGGNTVTLPAYTGGTGITVSGAGVISANNISGDVTGPPTATTVSSIQGTAVSATAPSSGQVLKYNGTSWASAADNDAQTLSIASGSLSISGGNSVTLPAAPVYTGGAGITVSGSNVISVNSLAGDVTGATGTTKVEKIQGTAVSTTAPASGQVLKYNGTVYAPAADAGVVSTATVNYVPKTTGTGTQANSAIYDPGGRIGINTTAPQLDLDLVGDSLGLRNPGAPWDNIWMHADANYASLNANGADFGLMFRVGAAGSGTSVNNTSVGLDTVMTLLPGNKVGINTLVPKSTLEVVGSVGAAIKNVVASNGSTYSAGDEYTIICQPNSTTTTTTVSLPAASTMKGRMYVIRRLPAAAAVNPSTLALYPQFVAITAAGGSVLGTTLLSGSGVICVTYQSDGANWISIGQF